MGFLMFLFYIIIAPTLVGLAVIISFVLLFVVMGSMFGSKR